MDIVFFLSETERHSRTVESPVMLPNETSNSRTSFITALASLLQYVCFLSSLETSFSNEMTFID